MAAAGQSTDVVALGPLRWSLAKIKKEWEGRLANLEIEAGVKTRDLECKHREQRRALAKHLQASREAVKAEIPLNGRLATMKASYNNLTRLGRADEAEKVRRKLHPLEKGFWAKALAASGFADQAKHEKEKLLGAQQAELGTLSQALRRDSDHARKARDAEIKAQQRRNRCSSDDVWSIWSAAKLGETERLSYMLSLPRAYVDARDLDSGWTSLHFASRQGKLGAVEALIGHKAFVGARGPDGRTPLHLAAGWGTYEVCSALLHAGADKNAVDRHGLTPRQLALARQRDKIAEVLNNWRPIGLTATQTQKIIQSHGDEPPSAWESETDPGIRSQLRLLDVKQAKFGERHEGTRTTLGKLAGLCREAGRLQDAKQHLERLVELLQSLTSRKIQPTSATKSCVSAPPRDRIALAVALGNLGAVCHELGDADQASGLLESSLQTAVSVVTDSQSYKVPHSLIEVATRNLGLHYLSEGRVDRASARFRECVKMREATLRSDMVGGDESVDLIPPLTLLSYADMLAGDHAEAKKSALRAQAIAASRHRHGYMEDPPSLNVLMVSKAAGGRDLSDPIPRLEWLGVQQFEAGNNASAAEYFARARALVLKRGQQSRSGVEKNRRTHDTGRDLGGSSRRAVARLEKAGGYGPSAVYRPTLDANAAPALESLAVDGDAAREGNHHRAGAAAGEEFHPDAMRLDRCIAVAICRQGPEAF